MIPAGKLERLLDRFHAVEAELASGAGGNAYVKLSKEHAELAPVISAIEAYRAVESQLGDAEALFADPATAPEMKALAEEERAGLKRRIAGLERDLKLQLLPKDTADSSSAIMEIRAGTGGDEAAPFAGGLLHMYQRFCQLQGWRPALMSLSGSDL